MLRTSSLTDNGNARRFTEDHLGRLIYVDGPGWYRKTGGLWKPLGKDEVLQFAKRTAKKIRQEIAGISDDRAAEKCLQWAKLSNSEARLVASARLAAAGDLDMPSDLRVELSELDRDPEVLNTPSGAVNLRTGWPVEPSAERQIYTKITRAAYDPGDWWCPAYLLRHRIAANEIARCAKGEERMFLSAISDSRAAASKSKSPVLGIWIPGSSLRSAPE